MVPPVIRTCIREIVVTRGPFMYRVCSLHAYDVLDTIVVSVQLSEFDKPGEHEITRTIHWHDYVSSVGDDDPSLWLWRVLQLMQEHLEEKPAGDPT
jgi:hypothetical protein